ncbi:MAG: shikimate kinase [Pirellulaceae bacterium]
MNIVLVGYRGTGKTAVAALLAQHLGLGLVHLDAEIERRAGKRIPQLVDEVGWPGFRDLEEEIVCTFAARDGLVLDCGGGVIERDANFSTLQQAGPVIWLKASVATIVQRIQGDGQRPSLTGKQSFTDEVAEVLERRTPRYRQIAHHEVETDARTVEQVAAEIERLLKSNEAAAS